ncbi:MAG: type IV pilus twitching motility protein PilT [Endomicrobiales bacterium]|nr:type IV pilus twitching motility protein PilT [Endomicrobiales bacterium]
MNVNELLQLMVKKGISDIHFKADSAPLLRMNGKLVPTEFDRFSSKHIEELANSFMNGEQKKVFENENELDIAYSIDELSRFRINMYRQRGSTALTLRVVPLDVKKLEELNLPAEALRKLAAESRGLILIAGVTGAGKTTTMNSILNYINENFQYNIVTVEDPIEYYHKDRKSSISQREVGVDTKSYARALKYVLRQDPDVVVIGEMRDYEAMSAGITAAETGHLVLSTIHTMDAVQTIDRLVDSYPPHQQASVRSQLGNVIKGIVAQRLITTKDGNGRVPATEILIGTSLIRKLISEGKISEVYKAMEQGAYYGMHTFDNDLFELCKKGVISAEEALDKSTNPDDLTLKLKGIERGE